MYSAAPIGQNGQEPSECIHEVYQNDHDNENRAADRKSGGGFRPYYQAGLFFQPARTHRRNEIRSKGEKSDMKSTTRLRDTAALLSKRRLQRRRWVKPAMLKPWLAAALAFWFAPKIIAATYSDSFCDPDCIVNELPKQIEAMRTSTDTEAKALAMSWVIHLMGDLHQPMHVTDRGDRGGNEFKVTYNGRTRCRESNSSGTETKVELHSAWDSCLVFTLESGRTFDKLADDLRGNLTTYKGHPAASGTMMDWMKETHQAGIDTAYDGNVVWAIDRGACGDAEVLRAFPHRRPWRLLVEGRYRRRPIDPSLRIAVVPYTGTCST